MAGMHVNLNFE